MKSAESIVSHVRASPNDANCNGKMFGGRIMEIMDSCAGIAALRFATASHHCVTASVDNVQFRLPVHIGDVLRFTSRVIYTGHTSMVVRVEVHRFATGESSDEPSADGLCTRAHLVFVAMDANGKPSAVPGLELTSDDDRRDWDLGKAIKERLLQIARAPA